MNIVDILILIVLIGFTIKGFKEGAIKEGVSFLGGILVLVLSFILKNPVSVFLYDKLPFLNFEGIFSGITVMNILVYEAIAFIIVASILLIIFKILIKLSNILEFLVKITIILELPSKIIGAVLGFLEGYLIAFILLFVAYEFQDTKGFIDNSKYGNRIISETPVLSNAAEPMYNSVLEIYTVAEKYANTTDKGEANLEALEILLKYDIITPENAKKLVEDDKINFDGAKELIEKY